MASLSETIKSFVSQQKIDSQTNRNKIVPRGSNTSKPPKIEKKPKPLPVSVPVLSEVESHTAESTHNRPVAKRASAVALNKPQTTITIQGRLRS